MRQVLVIGIGAGDPDHVTVQAVKALNRVDVFFVMDKGAEKEKLAGLRREVCARFIEGRAYRLVEAVVPERRREGVEYGRAVAELNAAKGELYRGLIERELGEGECGAFLVWGDPSLYDSTIRILRGLQAGGCSFEFEVVPGISSVQALAARHRVALTQVGEALEVTTGRRLAEGAGERVANAVVMLDGEEAFTRLAGEELEIFWGAYVGTADEILISGRLGEVAGEIVRARRAARAAHGWIMDCYLLRRGG